MNGANGASRAALELLPLPQSATSTTAANRSSGSGGSGGSGSSGSSGSSSRRTRSKHGGGHSSKRSFGARFFKRLKETDTSSSSRSNHENGGSPTDDGSVGSSTTPDSQQLHAAQVAQQTKALCKLNEEVKVLRATNYESLQFQNSVSRNVVLWRGMFVLCDLNKRVVQRSILRCFSRWILMTWSSKVTEKNNTLSRLRKKEYETHGVKMQGTRIIFFFSFFF